MPRGAFLGNQWGWARDHSNEFSYSIVALKRVSEVLERSNKNRIMSRPRVQGASGIVDIGVLIREIIFIQLIVEI